MAIGYKKEHKDKRVFTIPFSSRLIQMKFKMKGPPLQIVSAYAPQSGRSPAERKQFFIDLAKVCNNISIKEELLVLGDLNARLHCCRHSEEDIIGTHVYGRGRDYLENLEEKAYM